MQIRRTFFLPTFLKQVLKEYSNHKNNYLLRSKGLQSISKGFPKRFKRVSKLFQKGFQSVSKGFPKCFKRVSKEFQRVSKEFQSVSKGFPKCFKRVSKGFTKGFKPSETGFPKGFTATSNPLENAFVDKTCFRMEGHIYIYISDWIYKPIPPNAGTIIRT